MWLVGEGSGCLFWCSLFPCPDPGWLELGEFVQDGFYLQPMVDLALYLAPWSWWQLRFKNAFWLGALPLHVSTTPALVLISVAPKVATKTTDSKCYNVIYFVLRAFMQSGCSNSCACILCVRFIRVVLYTLYSSSYE
ncbi:hypothetical protein BS78_06G281700 [Paspalum vaginatum]|nr:hypothetical protein BS78_06G281700 [Paspalum vaginatum]